MGQVGRVGEQLALVGRVLVEDVDAGADDVVGLHRQYVLQLLQGGDAGLVGVVDLEIFQITGEHVDGHVLDHLGQARRLGVELELLGDHAPGEHGRHVVAVRVHDRRDQQVKVFPADLDDGRVGQVCGIGEQLALMGRVLVEDVDAGADDVIGLHRQHVLQLLQGGDAGLVGVGNLEFVQIAYQDVDGHVLDHLLVHVR